MSALIYRSVAVGAAHTAVDVFAFKAALNMDEAKRAAASAASDYVACQAILAYYPEGYNIWQPVASGVLYCGGANFLKYDNMPLMYQFLIQAGSSYLAPLAYDRLIGGLAST